MCPPKVVKLYVINNPYLPGQRHTQFSCLRIDMMVLNKYKD